MPFQPNNFGLIRSPLRRSLYVQNYEDFQGNPLPPTTCLLGIAATSGVLALQVGGFLAVHCVTEKYNLVDYQGNTYSDYQNNNYVEIQP